MENTKKMGKELYENLGKLFYAIAMADSRVHAKEVSKLRSFIRKYWLEVDELEDEFGTDAAFQIESVFDWAMDKEKDSEVCFDEFKEFYKDNSNMFSKFIKVLILDTANAISNSFSGKNKAELVMLGKLELLLKK
ncbi:hypothetical protein [Arenibacter algicola]|jgi:hypothetical protein|uniref:Co-chaperone DjlA N-terminal domain-containing protein n=1 Tax=Arenibacter algicola TaxID=616991 RepID=A0A221V020_9FLAO|nr:hypothetical protein [Arenibacter algicola]ASO06957.1 hypothetical protein AREALGSMS7_03536 [Arenibacter algicola]MDX1758209.1 hypothetical protein [Arenibacter algicola]HCO85891.1 hypothetical protein [Arenibacter sp.]|tara:strand:+ start:20289 stop:20693 length:405 start_codon:yes stop_codon:yes gene_type:complete